MKKYFFVLIISFASIAAKGNHTVSGIVTGYKDSAVAGVTVFIPEFQKSDETKAGGTYIIRNVGKGRVHIQFSKQGYKTIVQLINTDDSALVLNVKMQPVLTEPEEFTELSGSPSLPENVPFTVNSLSAISYRQSGALGMMQGLALQPGVDRMSVGNGISKPVIRGMSLGRVQVREYGTEVGNQQWNDMHDIGVSENGVDYIEIVKGPAALKYGAGAMGGVLIFKDQKPAAAGTILGDVGLGIHSNPIGLEGELGFKGATTSGILYSVRGGVMSHTSYIQGQEADEVKKNTEEKAFAPNSKWGNENVKISVGLSKEWGVSKLTYSYYHQTIGIIKEVEENSFYTGAQETERQRERIYEAPYLDAARSLVSSENTFITGKSKVNINVAYQSNDNKEFEEDFTSTDETDKKLLTSNKQNTITFDLMWTSNPEKKFGFVIGAQGINTDTKEQTGSWIHPLDPDGFGGYVLFRYDIEKVNFLGGLRYDSRVQTMDFVVSEGPEDLKYNPVNGSIGIAYHPLKNLTVKLNGATGFTTPNELQLGSTRIARYSLSTDYLNNEHYRMELGNEDLKMEENREGDLGILFSSPNIDVNVSGFYNMVSDFIYLQNTGVTDTVTDSLQHIYDKYKYEQQDATFSGGELMFDIHPAPWKWFDLQLGYSMVRGELDNGNNVPSIPANKFISALTFHSKKLMWFFNPYLTIAGTYYSDQKDTAAFENISEAYSLFDVRIGLQLPFAHQVVDVNLAMTNMLNTPYMSHLSLVREIGIRDMGRNVSIKIRIPFGVKGFSR